MADPTAELLEMICARPDDDGPRGLLADWLEEHGECDRSEFVRVQLELAKLPTEPRTLEGCSLVNHRGPSLAIYKEQRGELATVKVGDRVNVRFKPGGVARHRKEFHSLLVTDITRTRAEGALELVMDEHSVPWPGADLRGRERELWRGNSVRWFPREDLGFGVALLAFKDSVGCPTNGCLGFVSRGFVSEVMLPGAAWWGEACRTCSGRGYRDFDGAHPERLECPHCRGQGTRTNTALGPRIVLAAPIKRVTLTDAIQERDYGGGDVRPAIYRDHLGPLWGILFPKEAFAFEYAERATREEFEAPLSDAALRWARIEADRVRAAGVKCERCDGNGAGSYALGVGDKWEATEDCHNCGGSGRVGQLPPLWPDGGKIPELECHRKS